MILSEEQKDVLTELINIGVGKGGATLNQMLDRSVSLTVPSILLLKNKKELWDTFENYDDELISGVNMGFRGVFEGSSHMIFPKSSAAKLVSALTGEDFDSPELESLRIGALSEIGNIVLNNVMGSLSNMFKKQLNYRVPFYKEGDINVLLSDTEISDDAIILFCKANFKIVDLQIGGDIIILFTLNSFSKLKEELDILLS